MRNRRAWLAGGTLLCAGLFYGYVLIPLGLRLPCGFYLLTGLRCPGCGVTGLCLELLHGRFAPAHNWGLVLAAPAIFWLAYAYWRGVRRKAADIMVWAVLAFLLLWAVFRNLHGL